VSWEKEHGRLDRRRLKRVAVTPEQIGLCGCWQVIAVRREREELWLKDKPPTDTIGYYAASLSVDQLDDGQLMEAIRGHWDAIENGAHHRRDASFREDACRVCKRGAAQVLAALRNVALGVYELEKDEDGKPKTSSIASQCRQMTFSQAFALINH
jgi:predicted transposase YbfD/YdcC